MLASNPALLSFSMRVRLANITLEGHATCLQPPLLPTHEEAQVRPQPRHPAETCVMLTPCKLSSSSTPMISFASHSNQSCVLLCCLLPGAPPPAYEEAPLCAYELTASNALPDKLGRLWGYDDATGQSCVFSGQSLGECRTRRCLRVCC